MKYFLIGVKCYFNETAVSLDDVSRDLTVSCTMLFIAWQWFEILQYKKAELRWQLCFLMINAESFGNISRGLDHDVDFSHRGEEMRFRPSNTYEICPYVAYRVTQNCQLLRTLFCNI